MAQVNKKTSRLRRARKGRALAKRLDKTRISVHRTLQHIYVQAIAPSGNVLVCASTLDKELKGKLKSSSNIAAAKEVGKLFAERCKALKLKDNIMFDRSGYKYHGRVKALADAIRENGIDEF